VNTYLEEVRRNLPRLLALIDRDRTSESYGMGDRYHWAWGLIDFGNGTFQGAAHGMARLWKSGLWPYATTKEIFLDRIDSLFLGAKTLTRKDGSLEEAFPNEGSYCVTALVAFDLLCALDLLGNEIEKQKKINWQSIIEPMIGYLKKSEETHALISNHLATAVAALSRWHRLTGDQAAERKARAQLDKILDHQTEEGWFKEYEGADPGYQTLCTYYLADVHELRPDWQLLEPLRRSIQFLWYFAHPDGSFAGLYGSRCTRFYYPAGVMALADEIPEAVALSAFMASSIEKQQVVNLSAMDEPNLVTMFNAYAWAAAMIKDAPTGENVIPQAPTIPCRDEKPLRKHFPQAGLWLDRGPAHYTIVNTHKGGVIYHFRKGFRARINAGIVVRNAKGLYGSSQAYDQHNSVQQLGDQLEIATQITAMPKQLPGPLQFLLLRLLCLTAFRSAAIREWIKLCLVHILITRRHYWPVTNLRSIHLGETLAVEDKTHLPAGYQRVENGGAFVPIHMASQGYWQIQDEEP